LEGVQEGGRLDWRSSKRGELVHLRVSEGIRWCLKSERVTENAHLYEKTEGQAVMYIMYRACVGMWHAAEQVGGAHTPTKTLPSPLLVQTTVRA
jgi:hypothetical protein